MHWSLYVLIGGVLNALVNWGYKTDNIKESFMLASGSVMAIAAACLFGYAFATKTAKIEPLLTGSTPFILAGMGVGVSLVMILFVNALIKGPLSIVDPMWACVYALASLAIGMLIIRETPSAISLAGVALYLIGALLMTKA